MKIIYSGFSKYLMISNFRRFIYLSSYLNPLLPSRIFSYRKTKMAIYSFWPTLIKILLLNSRLSSCPNAIWTFRKQQINYLIITFKTSLYKCTLNKVDISISMSFFLILLSLFHWTALIMMMWYALLLAPDQKINTLFMHFQQTKHRHIN